MRTPHPSNLVVVTALATLVVALPVIWQKRGCAVVGPQISADGTVIPGSITCGEGIEDKVVGSVDNRTGPAGWIGDSPSSTYWAVLPTSTPPSNTPADSGATDTLLITTTVSTQTVTIGTNTWTTQATGQAVFGDPNQTRPTPTVDNLGNTTVTITSPVVEQTPLVNTPPVVTNGSTVQVPSTGSLLPPVHSSNATIQTPPVVNNNASTVQVPSTGSVFPPVHDNNVTVSTPVLPAVLNTTTPVLPPVLNSTTVQTPSVLNMTLASGCVVSKPSCSSDGTCVQVTTCMNGNSTGAAIVPATNVTTQSPSVPLNSTSNSTEVIAPGMVGGNATLPPLLSSNSTSTTLTPVTALNGTMESTNSTLTPSAATNGTAGASNSTVAASTSANSTTTPAQRRWF